MTTISAEVVADSVSAEGRRITTLQLRYPRLIHAEFMTHRSFSRNARSSRAVPVETMLKEIEEDPVVPLYWGANQRGMQASEECNEQVEIRELAGSDRRVPRFSVGKYRREDAWLKARNEAVTIARAFHEAGYHKQNVNRLLEPFMHIDVVVTSTEWSNFFALRDHHMAEPHIAQLAQGMRHVMSRSVPKLLEPGDWHLPYVRQEDRERIVDAARDRGREVWDLMARAVSVARCARVSYRPFGAESPSLESEIERHDQLVGARPMHASPCEHQATPDTWHTSDGWRAPQEHGNLVGWRQYRKMLAGECA